MQLLEVSIFYSFVVHKNLHKPYTDLVVRTVACGGGMYFTAAFSTSLNLLLLRFGPRASTSDDSSVASRNSGSEWSNLVGKDVETGKNEGRERPSYGGTERTETFQQLRENKTNSRRSRADSIRNRPSLL